jgi:hypothetical protein
VEQALEASDQLVLDALEPRAFLLRRTRVREEVALVAAGAARRQFVAGQADLAPVFLPGLRPGVAGGKAGQLRFVFGTDPHTHPFFDSYGISIPA